jgi:hypothetical protein
MATPEWNRRSDLLALGPPARAGRQLLQTALKLGVATSLVGLLASERR